MLKGEEFQHHNDFYFHHVNGGSPRNHSNRGFTVLARSFSQRLISVTIARCSWADEFTKKAGAEVALAKMDHSMAALINRRELPEYIAKQYLRTYGMPRSKSDLKWAEELFMHTLKSVV